MEKIRVGGKLHRRYDQPKTPYPRLMESDQISGAARKRLQSRYESLNVAELHRRIEELKSGLFDLIEGKGGAEPAAAKRCGPAIRVGGRAHATWMRKMMGEGK